MKTIMILAALFSANAYASSVSIQATELRSPKVKGTYPLRIFTQNDGKLRIIQDPNTCNESGSCTKIAVFSQVVEAQVLRDDRPMDGNLLLGLTDEIQLLVGSGFNLDEHIAITALVTNADGSVSKLPMSAEVNIQVSK